VKVIFTLTEIFFLTVAEKTRPKIPWKLKKFIGGIFGFFLQRAERSSKLLLAFI